MTDLLQAYYIGVLQRLKAEINLLNSIVPHNSTKGTLNEDSLKSIIEKFIPKRYSVGSGIIIDSFGNSSKQIDIVIYDSSIYPSLFGQTSVSLFPVETVLAAIEVKTYLDNQKLKDVTENTKSIKKLRHYVDKITINKPTSESPVNIVEYILSPPASLLFAFNLDSQDPKTWKKRFVSLGYENLPMFSTLLEISASFQFNDFDLRNEKNFVTMYSNLREGDIKEGGDFFKSLASDKADQLLFNDKVTYKTASFKEENAHPYLMPERALLFFLLTLNDLIEETPKHLTFNPSNYFKKDFLRGKFF